MQNITEFPVYFQCRTMPNPPAPRMPKHSEFDWGQRGKTDSSASRPQVYTRPTKEGRPRVHIVARIPK
jgi:hypothetical protein